MSKLKPVTREEFKQKCLRKLGAPVLQINVSDDQVEDNITSAIDLYTEFHYKGSYKTYLKHALTADDISNGYIETNDENIIGVIDLFDVGSSIGTGMFNVEYQMMLSDFRNVSSQSLVPYYLSRFQLETVRDVLNTQPRIRFNVNDDRIYIDDDLNKFGVGRFFVFEVYKKIDEDTNSDLWSDRWLQNYATSLIKKQWGSNISKFDSMQLPGGVTFNGRLIYDDAIAEIDELMGELTDKFTYPPEDMVG